MSDDIIIDDGEPVDTGDASTSDPVDQEPVVDPGDDGNRPIIDWGEDPIEGDANAQQTFNSQPTPPYRPGDLWQNGTAWNICVNGKASGQSFAATDWEPFEAVEPTPTTSTRTVTYVEAITDYSAAKLAEYEARGAVAYAVYDDGTRQQVAWSAVSEPQTTAPSVIADEALIIAQATNQHFWHRSTDPDQDGAGTGAFVTDEEQDDFLSAIASGIAPTTARPLHNLLMNAEGILIRAATRIRAAFTPSGVAFYDGQGNAASNVNAAFGSDGFQVGRTDESHLVGDYHSLQLMNKEGNAYFFVSDLRNEDGVVAVEQTFTGDGVTRMFWLWAEANSNDYTVDVSDGSGGSVSKFSSNISFPSAPSAGAVITVDYETEDPDSIAFTFGTRMAGEDVGLGSVGMGDGVCASGRFSHAEGTGTRATDSWTHAEGYGSVANAQASHAEGDQTEASGNSSHAEGEDTLATSLAAHAEGGYTHATGLHSHAEGAGSVASGAQSHAQNYQTVAARRCQTALGTYNVEDTASATTHPGGLQDCGTYAVIIGNGTALARSNALTVDWSGNEWVSGNVEVGGLLKLLNANIDRDGSAPSATVWSDSDIRFTDVNAEELAYLRVFENTSGTMAARLQVNNEPAGGGTAVSNHIQLSVSKNGTKNYSVGDAAAFRAALGFDTWTSVATADWFTADSGWTVTTAISYNAALGVVKLRAQFTATTAKTAGNKTLGTVKAAYRPSIRSTVPSLSAASQALYIDAGGSILANTSAVAANGNLWYAGEYHLG